MSASGRGRVVAFDARRGLGTVQGDDGVRLDFHCTRIVDGTRTIPVGVPVRYDVVPGARGRWEADRLTRSTDLDPGQGAGG